MGAFGRRLASEGGALMNRLSAIMKQTPSDLLHPLHHVRTQ